MEKHMATKHSGQNCPPEGIVSAAEKEILAKKTRNTKNNLKLADLKKLSDDTLKLLPLKDFWDSSKKEWKNKTYGTFAKQQSSKMKRIFGKENFE